MKLLSDYTSEEEANVLSIQEDKQGDIHIRIIEMNDDEQGVRLSCSGSRYSPKIRNAFQHLLQVYKEEIDENTHPTIQQFHKQYESE